LDITVKGQDPIGRIFAPTWEMVRGLKAGHISEENYTQLYTYMMRDSYKLHAHTWHNIADENETTFVCFCPPNAFCHRVILAKLFEEWIILPKTTYMGERG
jgi:hypothetical protein